VTVSSVVVLLNAAAGSVEDDDAATATAIEEAFAAAGVRAEVRSVPPERFADEVRASWRGGGGDGPDAVLVAGGDGTVNCGAGAAAGTDVVFGVVPLGTFNHFAKDLGLPADLAEAARALAGGEVREVDVAEVNGRAFVNNSVLGLYPSMVAIRDRVRDRRGWGKVRAVPVAAWAVLRAFPRHRLDLDGPGIVRRRVRTPLVFVGNGRFDNGDGGPARRDDLADGLLGVAWAEVSTRWGLVRAALRALWFGASRTPEVQTEALAELTVSGPVARLRVALDGEVCWLELPLRYRVRPGALRVLAPADER
jgi:diacylglycerol kinase family enzyme